MRLFVFIGGLLVLALLTALIGPYFVDWSVYRDRFEAEATRILGRQVKVEGEASARFLPFPSVTFTDVRVGDPASPDITVEEFSMDAELAPFMRGEILIFDMQLVSPVIRLDLDDKGEPIWDWPSQAPIDPAQITLENARFTDGTLLLRDRANNRHWDFVSLDGTAGADSLFGPWRLATDGLLRGVPFNGQINTGPLSLEGFSTRISAVFPTKKVDVSFDGRVAAPSGDVKSWYSGNFTLSPSRSEVQAYRVTGQFEADARGLQVKEFQGDFGNKDDPYTINGSAFIDGGEKPHFGFQAKGNQVILGNGEAADASASFADRIGEIQSVLATLPLPDMPGIIELDLPTISAGRTTIRDVKLTATPTNASTPNAWNIERFEAQLPGRTVLEGSGILELASQANAGSKNAFKGKLLLASRQPSGLAAWLTDDVDEAIRLLPNAGFSAMVDLDTNRQSFENVELILGSAKMNGTLLREASGETIPTIQLALTGKNADFPTLKALSGAIFGQDGSLRLTKHDVDVELKLQDAQIAGLTLGGVDASMRVRGDRTEFDRLSLTDFLGASVSATASVVQSNKNNQAQRKIDLDASLLSADGASFLAGLAANFPNTPILESLAQTASGQKQLFADTRLNIVGSAIIPDDGALEASASISGVSGGSDLSLTTTLRGVPDDLKSVEASLSGTLDNQEASTLVSQIGFDVFPIRPLGEGQARFNMSGSLVDGLSARLALDTIGTKMSTDGVFRKDDSGNLQFAGTGEYKSDDVEPWMEMFGYILPNSGFGMPFNIFAGVELSNNVYTLSNVKGDVDGNQFSGVLTLQRIDGAPKIDGDLRVDAVDGLLLANILSGRYDLADPVEPFGEPLYPDHKVDLSLTALALSYNDVQVNNAAFRMIYRDNALSLHDFSGEAAGGTMNGSLEAQNQAGSIIINGQVVAKNIDLAGLLPAISQQVNANGDMGLNFTGSGANQDALVRSLTGSGSLSATNVSLSAINPKPIGDILASADVIGYEISDEQIDAIINGVIANGSLNIASIETPLALNSGTLSVSNLSIALGGVTLRGGAQYALPDDVISGSAELNYDAGVEAVAGSEPSVLVSFGQVEAGAPVTADRDIALMRTYVRQRALEREQARVEALQARLLEKQRLRREVRLLRSQLKDEVTVERENRARALGKQRLEAMREAARLEAIRLAEEEARIAEEARLEAIRVEEEKAEAARIAEMERQAEEARAAEAQRAQQEAEKQQPPTVSNGGGNGSEPLPPVLPESWILNNFDFLPAN